MPNPLTPPDRKRCQAEKPNGATAFSLGGRPSLVRCGNPATIIVREKAPDENLQVGAMSLCDACRIVFLNQVGVKGYEFEDLDLLVKTTKEGHLLPTASGRFSHAHPNLSALPKKE